MDGATLRAVLGSWAVAMILVMACGAPTPTPQSPTPTPDWRLESLLRDKLVEALRQEFQMIAREQTRNYPGAVRLAALARQRKYVALYVARECVEGRELAVAGFRTFVRQSQQIEVSAKRIIRRLIDAENIQPDYATCFKPYLYPETLIEAALAIDLVAPDESNTNPLFRGGLGRAYEEVAYSWFDTRRESPFLPWFCNTMAKWDVC